MISAANTKKKLSKMDKRRKIDLEEKQDNNEQKIMQHRARMAGNILDMQHVAERTQ